LTTDFTMLTVARTIWYTESIVASQSSKQLFPGPGSITFGLEVKPFHFLLVLCVGGLVRDDDEKHSSYSSLLHDGSNPTPCDDVVIGSNPSAKT